MASLVRSPTFAEDPTPRTGFSMVLHHDHIYLWGGYTQDLMMDKKKGEHYPVDLTLPDTEDNFMDVYDILGNVWECHVTTGDVPDYGNGSTMVSYGCHLYLFGGWNEGDFSSEVHQLDIETYEWIQLDVQGMVKPSPRYLTEAVTCGHVMCIFGGTGLPPEHIQPGAYYIELNQFNHSYGFGWNNEMFFFDLKKFHWSVPVLDSGRRPPPSTGFSFNMIDTHRALLFGGRQGERRVADIYIFDFDTRSWSDVIVQQSPEQPWPTGRTFHSTTCLVDPRSFGGREQEGGVDQQLLVLWGKGVDNKHCKDVWVYNVRKKTWRMMTTDLRERMWHMACAYFHSTTRSDSILFGGNKHRKSSQEKHVMTDLTLFTFGVQQLSVLCLNAVRRHGLEELLEKLPFTVRNLFMEYNNAHFHYLSSP